MNNGQFVSPQSPGDAELLQKIQEQEEKAQQNTQKNAPPPPNTDTTVTPIQETQSQPQEVQEQPQIITTQSNESSKNKKDLYEKIRAHEAELGITETPSKAMDGGRKPSEYLDEYGNETYYVRNVSGNHIVISDISDMDKIEKGKCVDLLQMADIDTLKKSRDLRIAVMGLKGEKLLERITPEEYFEFLQKEATLRKRMNDNMYKNHPELAPNTNDTVSSKVLSKLEKFKLSTDLDPEKSQYGISEDEFTLWIRTEQLNESELDYILASVPNNRTVRSVVIEKKQELIS